MEKPLIQLLGKNDLINIPLSIEKTISKNFNDVIDNVLTLFDESDILNSKQLQEIQKEIKKKKDLSELTNLWNEKKIKRKNFKLNVFKINYLNNYFFKGKKI